MSRQFFPSFYRSWFILEHPLVIADFNNQILENIRDIIFSLGPDGTILAINREFENATGFDRAEWIGKNFKDLIHPSDLSIAMERFQAIIQDKKVSAYAVRVKTKLSGFKIFEANATPHVDSNGNIIGFFGIVRDITASKIAEETIQASEQQYRDIIHTLSDPIHVIDKDLRIIIANPTFSSWLEDLDLDGDITGKTISEAFPFLDVTIFDEYEYVFDTGETLSTEEKTTIEGNDYYTKTQKIPIIHHKEVVQVLTVIHDVTDHRKMEEQLRESEKKYRRLILNLTDIVAEVDLAGNFTFVSPQSYDLLGYLPEEVMNKSAFDFIHPDDYEPTQEMFEKALVSKKISFRYRIKHKNGHFIPVKASGKLIEQEGESTLVFVVSDISQQIEIERALRESEERLRSFMNAATDSFSVWDSDLNLIDVNNTGLKTFMPNTTKDDILGRNIASFHSYPEDVENYKNVIRTGEPFIEERIAPPRKYGDLIVSMKAFKVGDGLGIITTDITEQKKMETELRKSEERMRTFMDAATDTFSVWDVDLNLLDINETGLAMIPTVTREEVLGKNMKNFISDPSNAEKYREVIKTGKPFTDDRVFYHPVFGKRIQAVKAFKVGDGLGLITTDVTERKEMENILRENEEKFRYIFEKAPTGYALIDLELNSKLNPAFCEMLGYTDEDLEHLSYFKVIHPDHLIREKEQFQSLLEADVGVQYKSEKRYLTVEQKPFWARTTVTVLQDDQNKPKYFLATIEDITALKHREEEIKAQTLKYKIDDGNLYLVTEPTPSLSQSVLHDLKNIGYKGIIFSRTPKKDFSQSELGFDYIWLNEGFNTTKILESLEQLDYKTVILIDRLEYLITQEGFTKAIQFVYGLNEFINQNNLIVILSIDSSTISERELHILEKEAKPIEPKFLTKISEELREILRVVFQQNNLGHKPSYSFIGDELQISRPTTRKRLKQLVATGYLIEQSKGKSKVLEISTQGRSLFIGKKEVA